MKKKVQKLVPPERVVKISNCTINNGAENDEVTRARLEVALTLAKAISKVADSMAGPQHIGILVEGSENGY